MTLAQQILWGGMFLGLCLVLHIIVLAAGIQMVANAVDRVQRFSAMLRLLAVLPLALVVIVASHTLQTWIWAYVWIRHDLLADWNAAVYFSLVTYTSLGYGDIVLGPDARIFAAFASVTGLLGFGISTAYLVALMTRLLAEPDRR